VNSLHPGTHMLTKMVQEAGLPEVDTIDSGQNATHRLVADPGLAGVTGRFYDRTQEARAHASAYDPDVRRRLWQLSLDLTGAPEPA